jgi:hypothetical protein
LFPRHLSLSLLVASSCDVGRITSSSCRPLVSTNTDEPLPPASSGTSAHQARATLFNFFPFLRCPLNLPLHLYLLYITVFCTHPAPLHKPTCTTTPTSCRHTLPPPCSSTRGTTWASSSLPVSLFSSSSLEPASSYVAASPSSASTAATLKTKPPTSTAQPSKTLTCAKSGSAIGQNYPNSE